MNTQQYSKVLMWGQFKNTKKEKQDKKMKYIYESCHWLLIKQLFYNFFWINLVITSLELALNVEYKKLQRN